MAIAAVIEAIVRSLNQKLYKAVYAKGPGLFVGESSLFHSIQALRALAATMVAIFHIHMFSVGGKPIDWLSAGVDVFFVISGFVMVVSTVDREIAVKDFWLHRVVRIVPLYWICLTLCLVLLALQGLSVGANEIITSYLFIFHTNGLTGEATPILVPGWSLNYEVYFYLLFGLTMMVRLPYRILLLAAWFIALIAMRKFVPADSAFGFRMTSPLPLEFVAGMCIAYALPLLQRIPAIVGALVALAAFIFLSMEFAIWPRILFFGVPATLIVVGAVIAEPLMAGRWTRPLLFLGDASYSLYLSHDLVLTTTRLLKGQLAFGGWAGLFGMLAICVAVGVLLFQYVERPITTVLRNVVRRLAAPASSNA